MIADNDWWASTPGLGMCKKCGEERLVHQVADGRGVRNFCPVCANEWWLSGPLTHAEWVKKYDPYKGVRRKVESRTDAQGVVIDGP